MNHKLPPLPVRILVALIVLSTIGYYAFRALTPKENGQLKASGTIESVIVNVSPELAGKVADVLVEEGQVVTAGQPLLSLDGSLLAAQRAVASAQADSAKSALNTATAAYASAQSQYDAALSAALAAERASRTTVWAESSSGGYDLPSWYFAKDERLAAAQADVDAALVKLDEAFNKMDELQKGVGQSFVEIEAELAQARAAYQNVKAAYDRTSAATNGQDLRDAAQTQLDDAELALEDAQSAYDDALTTDGAQDLLEARAKYIVAQEIYNTTMDNLRALQTGLDSPTVAAAQKSLDQAKAAMEQAEAAVKTAEANLALLDTQIAKLTLYAPMDGIILTRNIEPGEFVQPGAVALTMANLDELTITVYVPEDQYGNISLGQSATVTVDSFPNETFTAEVIHIADQAEFTPRNVQTVEGRSSTVYAVKLKVTNGEGKLKIGMPADVSFK
ncbi:MAG: efflux RND transporter periplasmic adaptor subunit [Anaerolineales bacterium]|nr:efflux RND transporter periplasmic adaptor subunit [Anaerolineales bacterium]